jgi:Zn-finger protein
MKPAITGKACPHYPCHKIEDMECEFCYCPIYPCYNDDLGEYISRLDGSLVWDCSECTIMHTKKFVDAFQRKK